MLPFEHARKGLYLGGLAAALNRGIRWKGIREASFPTPPLLAAGPGGLFAIGTLLTLAPSGSVFDGLTGPQPKKNGDGDAEQKRLIESGVFHSKRELMLSFGNFFEGPLVFMAVLPPCRPCRAFTRPLRLFRGAADCQAVLHPRWDGIPPARAAGWQVAYRSGLSKLSRFSSPSLQAKNMPKFYAPFTPPTSVSPPYPFGFCHGSRPQHAFA